MLAAALALTTLAAGCGVAVLSSTVLSGGRYGFNRPVAIAANGTHVWVVNRQGDSVTELNASDGSWVRTLSGGSYGFNSPAGIADDGTHVWVANAPDSGGGSVTELNASDGSWVRTLSGGSYGFDTPQTIAADGTHVWVANFGSTTGSGSGTGSATELNASDGTWVRTVSQCVSSPAAIAVGGNQVWVAGGNGLTELNASDGRCARHFGAAYLLNMTSIAVVSTQAVLVASSSDHRVLLLDSSNGLAVSEADFGVDHPTGIAIAGAHIWVTALGDVDASGHATADSVSELNNGDLQQVQTLTGGSYRLSGPVAIAVDGAHVWVVNALGNSVTELRVG